MEQRKEVGTKDSSLSTLHNTFLFIAFLLFPAFLPLPPFLFVGAYLLCAPSFFFVLSDSVYFPHFYPDSSVFLPFVCKRLRDDAKQCKIVLLRYTKALDNDNVIKCN